VIKSKGMRDQRRRTTGKWDIDTPCERIKHIKDGGVKIYCGNVPTRSIKFESINKKFAICGICELNYNKDIMEHGTLNSLYFQYKKTKKKKRG